MEQKHTPNKTPEILLKNIFNKVEWRENVTILDLSNRKITQFDKNLKLPPNLVQLYLSNNELIEVPTNVLKIENLKILDISFNSIVLFDEKPDFCHTVEYLNLNNNKLEGPPYWVWSEKPEKLSVLDLSNNVNICNSFDRYYLEELIKLTTLVNKIDLHCCRLGKDMKFMSSFRHAKIVILGNQEPSYHSVNHIENVPCIGLEDCCDIEVLELSNTHIYNVQDNIDIYQNLVEINLTDNNVNSLPNEFCNLKKLQLLKLSHNKILYLPDDMYKLTNLTKLYLDSNDLCMLPENLLQLKKLKTLDLYNNHLHEGLEDISNLEHYDFAQNYGEEPNDAEYLEKKQNLRQNNIRLDGRKLEVSNIEYDTSKEDNDVEWWNHNEENDENDQTALKAANSRSSSPEDWDSDSYWIPSAVDVGRQAPPLNYKRDSTTSPSAMQWLHFVKNKMKEGNFCPMDMHLEISITDRVKHEKMCNPVLQYESDGQFDDYSDDDT